MINYPFFLNNIKHDMVAALSVVAFSLPTGIGIGVLTFGSLGKEYASLAIFSGLYAMLFSSLIYPVFGHSPHHFNGPAPASAGILGSMMIALLSNSDLQQTINNRDEFIAFGIAAVYFCIFLAGLIQLVVAQLRFGEIIKLIPHSVIAGITNGIAVSIIIQQLPVFFGLEPTQKITVLLQGDTSINYFDTLVSSVTIICMLLSRYYLPSWSRPLLGIIGGSLLYHGLLFVVDKSALGETIGHIPSDFHLSLHIESIFHLLENNALYSLLPQFLTTAITVALITGIGCLIVATTVDNLTDTRHDSVSELTALGITNMICPLFGGLPSGGSIGRVIANYNAGGKTKLSSLISAVLLLIFIYHFGFVVSFIPFSVIAATLLVMAISLMNNWTKFLIQRLFILKDMTVKYGIMVDLALVILVTLLMVFVGLTTAITVGIVIEFILFLLNSCHNLVRKTYYCDTNHSNNVRNQPAMDVLCEDGKLIMVLELQGTLFFGTADYLYRLTDKISDAVAIIIFDFRRIVDIDKSGANILKQIDSRLIRKNKTLLLAYLPKNSNKYLELHKVGFTKAIDEGRVFDDTNAALNNAEEIILSRRDPALLYQQELDLSGTMPLINFTVTELSIIKNYLERQCFCKNTCIVSEHDEINGMYILTLGRINVTKKIDENKMVTLVNFGPGVSFGEMGLFTKEKRSAEIYTTSDVVCYFLSKANFEHLQLEHSELALKFVSNIAASLSRRLFAASSVIRDWAH